MIRSALLAENAQPLTPSKGKGVNETWKGRFLLLDGASIEGYVKFIKGPQFINELLVSTLAQLVGLSVPEPFLVRVDKDDYPKEFAKWGITEDKVQVFGTSVLPCGSLSRAWADNGPDFINKLLDNSKEWQRLTAFDTWVGNIDRHFHNLYYDGSNRRGQLWLLDHGHCFGSPDWSEADLDGSKAYTNRFLEDLHTAGHLSVARRKSALDDAPQMQKLSSIVDLDGAIDDSYVRALTTASTAAKLIQYLHYRSQHLINLVADKVGMPQLALDNP